MKNQTQIKTKLNLGLMMFMQYMIMAVWWVPLAAYLANLDISSLQKSLILKFHGNWFCCVFNNRDGG